MTEISDPAELQGKKLVDPSGGEIGDVQEVYLDRETDRPQFVLVKTGLFGRSSTVVPLTGASLEGPRIWADVDKDQVSDAPQVDPEAELSPEQEAAIYRHYGISQSGPPASDAGAPAPAGSETRSPEPTAASAPTEQGTTAEAATPSAGATPGAPGESGTDAGLPRLRRYVVTEEVDVKVPVQREEVRVEPPEARSGANEDNRSA